MQTERRVAANPQTKPTDLGCESADKWLLLSTSTIAISYYVFPGDVSNITRKEVSSSLIHQLPCFWCSHDDQPSMHFNLHGHFIIISV